jgi:hypothetical protein
MLVFVGEFCTELLRSVGAIFALNVGAKVRLVKTERNEIEGFYTF